MTPMPPIQTIITAVCDAAGVNRAALVTARTACYARIALLELLMELRGMSASEAAVFLNYSRTGFVCRIRTLANQRTQKILASARWLIEQRHRPVGRNVLVQWPKTKGMK